MGGGETKELELELELLAAVAGCIMMVCREMPEYSPDLLLEEEGVMVKEERVVG